MGKLEEYKESSHKTRRAIPEIVVLNICMLDFERFRMVLFRLSLRNYLNSNHRYSMACFLLIHPLVTALAFVPITPAGAGFQEFGIVGILTLLFRSLPLLQQQHSHSFPVAC